MRLILSVFICLLMVQYCVGQNRSERPFQLQVNLSGFVLNEVAQDLSNRDVISLEVKEYEMPGLSVGYNLTKSFYFGYSFHPNRNYILTEAYSFEGAEDDILITVDHNTGTFHTLEGRLTPFNLGLYVSAFFTHVSAARYDLTGVPIDESYQIGNNLYEDALTAEWDFMDLSTFGLGAGLNHVFKNGFSFNIGAGIPLTFAKDIYDDVQVIREDDAFDEDDIQVIKDRLQDEKFYVPVQFYANLGWNF